MQPFIMGTRHPGCGTSDTRLAKGWSLGFVVLSSVLSRKASDTAIQERACVCHLTCEREDTGSPRLIADLGTFLAKAIALARAVSWSRTR